MDTLLRRRLETELETGERVLWATRPSVRNYILRRLPLVLVFVGAAIALFISGGDAILAAMRTGEQQTAWILGGVAVLPLLGVISALHLKRKTVYAITDRRLLSVGGKSILSNRPGQTFSLEPEQLTLLEFTSFGPLQHVYVDRQRWGDRAEKTVLIGFRDVSNATALRDRIQVWLDDWQQRLLSKESDRRVVFNDDYGFRVGIPAGWTAEVGSGEGSDTRIVSPTEWESGMRPLNDVSSGWNRLRVSGPGKATLAVEAVRAPLHRAAEELPAASEAALRHVFGLDRETREIEFRGIPSTLTTWSSIDLAFRVLVVPAGEFDFHIHLITRRTNLLLMKELQALAGTLEFRTAEVAKPTPGG